MLRFGLLVKPVDLFEQKLKCAFSSLDNENN